MIRLFMYTFFNPSVQKKKTKMPKTFFFTNLDLRYIFFLRKTPFNGDKKIKLIK